MTKTATEKVCDKCKARPSIATFSPTDNSMPSVRACGPCGIAALVKTTGKLQTIINGLRDGRDKLQAFKDWVHKYLDDHGVPKEFPDGPHTREGCRIGDRMDWLMAQLAKARDVADELAKRVYEAEEGV